MWSPQLRADGKSLKAYDNMKAIKKGDLFSKSNITVKRPGTGPIYANDYDGILGKVASRDIIVENNNIHDIISVDLTNSGFAALDLSVGVNAQYSNNINYLGSCLGFQRSNLTEYIQ